MDDAQPVILKMASLERDFDLALQSDEMDFGNRRVGLQGQLDPIYDDPGTVVATHDIHCDSHKWKERRRSRNPAALLKFTLRPLR